MQSLGLKMVQDNYTTLLDAITNYSALYYSYSHSGKNTNNNTNNN